MSKKYDYSIGVAGKVDLTQIQKDLEKQTFSIDIKMSNAARKAIDELKEISNNISNMFANMGKVSKLASGGALPSTDLELERRRKSQATLIAQIENRLNMGNRSGLFGVSNDQYSGEKLKAEYKNILETATNLDIKTESYKKNLIEAQTAVVQLNPAYQSLQKEAQKTMDKTDSFMSMMSKKLLNALAYRLIFSVFNTIKLGFNNVIKTTIDLDSQLRDINKVLDLTNQQMIDLTKSANNLAVAYARTTTEALKAMEYFAKAGFSYGAMQGLAELSIKLQNVGDLSSEAASSFIIAVNAAYQFEGSLQDLSKTIDIVNNLANNAAVSVDFLSEAMKVSGSVAYSAGLSLEEYTAALTTIGEATQRSGREVGNGLKTILLRLTQVTDSSGDMEDGLSKVEKVLRNVGIEIRDTPNSFRPAMEILSELAEKWENLTDIQQRAVTYNLAGVYRSNILESFLANINDYEENLFITLNSVGSATRENELYINSLEASLKRLRASWEAFVIKAKASAWIRAGVNAITFAVKNLDAAIYSLTVIVLGILLMKLPLLYKSFTGLVYTIRKVAFGFTELGAAASKAAMTTQAWVALAAILVVAVMAITNAVRKAAEAQQKQVEEAARLADEMTAQFGQLNILANQYEKLREQYAKTGEGADQLKDIQEQLTNQYGRQAQGIDLVNGKYEENIKLLQDLKKEQLTAALERGEDAVILAENMLKKNVGSISGIAKDYSVGKKLWHHFSGRAGLSNPLMKVAKDAGVNLLMPEIEEMTVQEYKKYLKKLRNEIIPKARNNTKYDESLTYIREQLEEVDKYIGNSESVIDSRVSQIRDLSKMDIANDISKLQGREKSLFDFLSGNVEVTDVNNRQKALDKHKNSLLGLVKILEGINADNLEERWQKILGLNIGITDRDKSTFIDHITNPETILRNLVSTLQESLTPFQQYIKKLEDLEKAQEKIFDLRRSIADEAKLVGDDYMSFALGGDGFLDLIGNEDLRKLAKEIQDEYIKYQEDIRNSEEEGLNNQASITTQFETQLKLKEKELKILQKQVSLEEKRKALSNLENERTQAIFIGGQMVYTVDYAAVEKAREELLKEEQEETKLKSELETDTILAQEQASRLALTNSMEELKSAIEKSTSEASTALEDLGIDLANLSSKLLDGETGLVAGIRGPLMDVIQALKDSFLGEQTPTGIDPFFDYSNRSQNTKAIAEGRPINIQTVNVSGVDNLDGLLDEIKTKVNTGISDIFK